MSASSLKSENQNDLTEALSRFDREKIRTILKNTDRPNLDHLPTSSGMPIVGHIYWMATDLHQWLENQYEKHGPVFRFKAFSKEFVFLLGPDANRLLLQNEDKMFSNYVANRPIVKNLLDDNVLSIDFDYHKSTRKSLQAAFKRQAIEGHIELMNPFMRKGIEQWVCDRTIKSTDHIRKILLDTGAKVFLGLDPGSDADMMNAAFVELVAGGGTFIRSKKIPFSTYAKGVKARQRMNDFIHANIKERRKTESNARDIFTQLCQTKDDDGNYFSDEEICNQIIFILFAAHDTTASVLSSTFYHLASDLKLQEQLREEMFSLNKQDLAFEDFDLLEKTTWTFQEALRMYPPVPIYPRYALKNFEFAGHHIPANTSLFGSNVFTHYMKDYWIDPFNFDPERFSPARAEDKKDFFQYIPFGGGAHKCLGLHFAQLQGKMFLFNFLKSYRIEKNASMTSFKYNNYPLTFPSDGLPLTFKRL